LSHRPSNFEVDRRGGAEPEVKARVVCGDIAGLAHDFLRLSFVSAADRDTGAESAAVALCPIEADLDPVIPGGASFRRREGASF